MSLIIFSGEEIFSFFSDSNGQTVSAIEKLQEQNIPLVVVTSKTRAEVAALAQLLNIPLTAIVEAGSAVYIPEAETNFQLAETSIVESDRIYQLGCSYTEARAALKAVQEEINKVLRGFGDLDEANVRVLIDATQQVARRAKSREFSEYFLTPSRLEIEQLQQVATEYGFRIIPGSKLSLITGAGANVATAMHWLQQNYVDLDNLTTVGIGNVKSDLTMLKTAGVSYVVPSIENEALRGDRNWQVARVGIAGWQSALERVCSQYLE